MGRRRNFKKKLGLEIDIDRLIYFMVCIALQNEELMKAIREKSLEIYDDRFDGIMNEETEEGEENYIQGTKDAILYSLDVFSIILNLGKFSSQNVDADLLIAFAINETRLYYSILSEETELPTSINEVVDVVELMVYEYFGEKEENEDGN